MINPIPHNISTRYAKNNFLINWPNKTSSGRHFQIIGTKIINNIPSNILNLPLSLFKKKNQWLLDLDDSI
jgi:hypothetical protein